MLVDFFEYHIGLLSRRTRQISTVPDLNQVAWLLKVCAVWAEVAHVPCFYLGVVAPLQTVALELHVTRSTDLPYKVHNRRLLSLLFGRGGVEESSGAMPEDGALDQPRSLLLELLDGEYVTVSRSCGDPRF